MKTLIGVVARFLAAILLAIGTAGLVSGNATTLGLVLITVALLLWFGGGRLLGLGDEEPEYDPLDDRDLMRDRAGSGSAAPEIGNLHVGTGATDDDVRYLWEDVNVNGAQHYQTELRALYDWYLAGGTFDFFLTLEPENPHDKNAIRVDATWQFDDGGAVQTVQRPIGYLPRGVARAMADYRNEEHVGQMELRAFSDRGDGLIQITLNIPMVDK